MAAFRLVLSLLLLWFAWGQLWQWETIDFEPTIDPMMHSGNPFPTVKGIHLSTYEVQEGTSPPPGYMETALYGFDRDGQVYVYQTPLVSEVGVRVLAARVSTDGRRCSIASNDIADGDRAGVNFHEAVALDNPQCANKAFAVIVFDHKFFTPASPTLYRTGWRYGAETALAIQKSTDGGKYWETVPGVVSADIEWLSPELYYLHPSIGGTFFVLYYEKSTPHSQLAVTRDDGRTFAHLGPADDYSYFEISKSDPKVWYRINREDRIQRSDDGGQSFQDVSMLLISRRQEVGNAADSNFKAFTLSIHPQDARLVLVVSNKGLLRSENSGKTWSRVEMSIPKRDRAIQVAFNPRDGEIAYATTGTGFFVSYDRGKSWSRIDLPSCIGKEKFKGLRPIRTLPNPLGSGPFRYVRESGSPHRPYRYAVP